MILDFLILFSHIYIISALILFAIIFYIKNYRTKELEKGIEERFSYEEDVDVMAMLNIIPFIPILNTLIVFGVLIKSIFKINIFQI